MWRSLLFLICRNCRSAEEINPTMADVKPSIARPPVASPGKGGYGLYNSRYRLVVIALEYLGTQSKRPPP